MQRNDLFPVVWMGFIAATAISLGLTITIHGLGASLEGQSEEIFEVIMMLSVAGLLTWMV